MRVLHLPSSYLPDTLGGTEIYVAQLTEELRALGHHSSVAWHTRTRDLGRGSCALPPLGVRTRHDVYTRDTGRDPVGMEQLLARERPDLIHFHALTSGAGPDHARVARRLGVPYLITFHTPAMACPRGSWMYLGSEPCDGRLLSDRCATCLLQQAGWPLSAARLGGRSPLSARALPDGPWQTHFAMPSLVADSIASWRRFFDGAAHVVACAAFVERRLVENGVPPARITMLRQALPGATRLRELVLPARERDGALRLGFVGRVTRIKGPDLLLSALRELHARGLHCVAELVGPVATSERSWVDTLLRDTGASGRHLGELRGEELRRWMGSIDVLVIPSRGFETGPLTLLEAWDAGKPVLGSDLGGIQEFMRGQGVSDCLFPVESARGIADAVQRLLARQEPLPLVEVPGMEQLGQAMVDIYGRCLEQHGGVHAQCGHEQHGRGR